MVWGKDHLENQVHNEKEVTEAVRRMNKYQYTALLTETYFAYVADMCDGYKDEDDVEDHRDETEYEHEIYDGELVYVADEDLEEIQAQMTEVAFNHG